MLAFSLDLNVTYLVLWLLISFRESLWYGLVYYVWSITTTWRSKCATSIQFTIYKVTVIYQYMSASCYLEIHLLRFIRCYCTLIYNEYVIAVCFVINRHKTLLILQIKNLFRLWCFVTQLLAAFKYIYDLLKESICDTKKKLKDGALSRVVRLL